MSTPSLKSCVLIGFGKMAGAMHQKWEEAELPLTFHAISPSQTPRQERSTQYYNSLPSADSAITNADIIMLGVKPQMMESICAELKTILGNHKPLILTIAAGLDLNFYEQHFGKETPIIRIMPNTPSAVGQGVSAYMGNEACAPHHLDEAQMLLTACGSAHLVETEDLIDKISTVSGSGPAYFYYFTQSLTQAAIELGLPQSMAESIARDTFIGAAALAEHDTNTPIHILRENVTSKGGTTAAALAHIMDGTLQETMNNALKAALARAQELNAQSKK